MAACEGDPEVIVAGTLDGQVFYSLNGGESWEESDSDGLPPEPIWTVSPSPSDCYDVLVGVGYDGTAAFGDEMDAGDRLLRKTDVTVAGPWQGAHGGAQSLPRAPTYAIIRHPSAADATWYVAGDVGVFRTDDGGTTWTNATAPLGLPNTLVRDLRLSADGETLYAGTFGRGVWRMDVKTPGNHYGVRGRVTRFGGPVDEAVVKLTGPGVIRRVLSNTLTNNPIFATPVITAPIEIEELATISDASAFIRATNVASAYLITPAGEELSLTRFPGRRGIRFSLSSLTALALTGEATEGEWRFKLVPRSRGLSRLSLPMKVLSASVSFEFTGAISASTGIDGEYTIEYLEAGQHTGVANVSGTALSQNFDISDGHLTDVDFEFN
jgi:hypothetical protein